MDATALSQKIRQGDTTVESAVTHALGKIEASHTQLNAAAEIMRNDALAALPGLPDGRLKGLPISVKECFAIKGKLITSASRRMKPLQCTDDAAVVKRLKAAGAVIVARGNTSEFLLGRETDNLVFGTTNNSLDHSLTTGGSSGGDGVLTATECVAFGIGTDIGGSCRYPALFNGIVGFKPASGQIDKTGVFPAAGHPFVESMNSPGILTRSVRDARMVYNVIGNKLLAEDDVTGRFHLHTCSTFRVKIKDEAISNALQAATGFLQSIASNTRDVIIPDSGTHYLDFATLMTGGFTELIYEWSGSGGENLTYVGELFRRMRGRPTLSNELFAMLLPFNLIKPSTTRLERTVRKAEDARSHYQGLLGGRSVLVLPTAGISAPRHGKFVSQYNKPGVIDIITPVSFCNIYNLSCITIPAWKLRKQATPPGIQLAVAPGSEALLLNVAERLEQFLRQ